LRHGVVALERSYKEALQVGVKDGRERKQVKLEKLVHRGGLTRLATTSRSAPQLHLTALHGSVTKEVKSWRCFPEMAELKKKHAHAHRSRLKRIPSAENEHPANASAI
jgi:hypothetical protein